MGCRGTEMNAVLLLWTLLVCVSGEELPPCSVGPVLRVSPLSRVSVSCPPVPSNRSEVTYKLLLNGSRINQVRLSEESGSALSWFSAQFLVSVSVGGVFVCSRERIYPPPYRTDCVSTVVMVTERVSDGTSAAIDGIVPAANQSRALGSSAVPQEVAWAGCAVLLVYSLSITCVAVLIWRKMKRDEDDTNEYVNTKPGRV